MASRPLHDKLAELKARGPKPVNYERIEPQAWGPADVTPEQVRLLRGRVLVEPLSEVESSVLFLPDSGKATERTLARGRVVAMGPPMQKKCKAIHVQVDEEISCLAHACDGSRWIDIPPGFKVGDVVLHVGQHRSRDVELATGKYRSVAQEEVQAVIEGEVESVDTSHGGAPDYRSVIR